MSEIQSPINSPEQQKVPLVSEQVTESINKYSSEASQKEAVINQVAREKLNGILPEDFKKAAKKQTLLGLGSLGVSTGIATLVGAVTRNVKLGVYAGKVSENAIALVYDSKKDGNLQDLSTTDWIAGNIILNPIMFGGIRNWVKANHALQEVDRKVNTRNELKSIGGVQ